MHAHFTEAMAWAVGRVVKGDASHRPTKVTHKSLSWQCAEHILYSGPGFIDINIARVDICYPPNFQSGGEYDLRDHALSSDKNIDYGVVHISLGIRYHEYCSNVSRTLMFNSTKAMEETYAAALTAHEAALAALVDGADLAAPFDAAKVGPLCASQADSKCEVSTYCHRGLEYSTLNTLPWYQRLLAQLMF